MKAKPFFPRLAVSLAALFGASILGAQTIHHVDASAGAGADDGSSWADAYLDLQSALSAAVAGDEIWVAEGIYRPTAGADRTLAFEISADVEILGGFPSGGGSYRSRNPDPATNGTVLSGDLAADDGSDFANNGENTHQILRISGVSPAMVLDGFTIHGGNGDVGGYDYGGGMALTGNASPSVLRCIFDGNAAVTGGAVYANSLCNATFAGCVFQGNAAVERSGGVTPYGGAMNLYGCSPTVSYCQFLDNRIINSSSSGSAGAVHCDADSTNGANASFGHCVFRGNQANSGGGALLIAADQMIKSNPTLVACVFEGNRAGSAGGALTIFGSAPTLTNCLFAGNFADSSGGAIFTNSVFNGDPASPVLTNVTFAWNAAGLQGGAAENQNGSTVRMTNCIAWGNTAVVDPQVDATTVDPASSHCLVEGGLAGFPSFLTSDPMFAANPSDGGDGFTDDPATGGVDESANDDYGNLRLILGSPALNAGDNSADLDGSGSGTVTIGDVPGDLEEDPRVVFSTVDLGAFEELHFSYADLYSALDPGDDDNGDGLSNFDNYSIGIHPLAAFNPAFLPHIAPGAPGEFLVTFRHRSNAYDVVPEFRSSTSAVSWSGMIPGVDHAIDSTFVPVAGVQERTLSVVPDPRIDRLLWMQDFVSP